MVVPAIVQSTDLAVVMPLNMAEIFAADGSYAILKPALPLRDFAVPLRWSRRFEADPANRWMRQTMADLLSESATSAG